MTHLLRLLVLLALPAAILGAAFAFVFFGAALPPALAGLELYFPYAVFAAGAALALAYNRGRALFALVTLVAAYGAQQLWLQGGLTTAAARTVYLALTVFVPVNLGLLAVLPERGVFSRFGALWLAVVAIEVALPAGIIASGRTGITEWAAQKFIDPAPFGIGAIPQAGIVAVLSGLVIALAAVFLSRSATAASCAGAVVALAVAAHVPTASLTFSVFIAAAELMLAIAILQDRYAMRSTNAPGKKRARAK